ncbi:ABC transporter ATP-binding protein [Pelagibacterium halotolerans]|uniref:Peptide/opine/nickel uptake family ABC transporter, ATP-binding protein n=1 Tax=Pelagibacterium halotolerans (strain DSM 22347 / JCM 15775 / CGMCC 1.7692 / B2) TaxID=1082931 RepID=G4RAG2_PELHB|nr:dipeptide ABC transporter ATP-binding protein [Pelagibacterium halotolerans]AEQ51512.1 peptide/opine/nickel uptake family ABC transporter, ATP-binding protein [Pelagibacterium halotolerans B2]QJR18650.1 ABC transporter ATP-binding protein [Pelagibacterium halotolerans]SEA15552.1 peptide/nickel transport system ATP-binding protein [Pelagibacterium halotolerans]
MSLLRIEKLGLTIGDARILDDVSLEIGAGKVLGLVGESGSGKSLTALSIMRLLPGGAKLTGKIGFDGRDLVAAGEGEMNGLRGQAMGMIFQEPMTALNPLMTIGDQVAETVRVHRGLERAEARMLAAETLERVGLPGATISPSRYPHELSGGQRQRVGIAMAIALRPRLLIADEPTTALDVTTQAQILDLLAGLVREEGMALMLITHDLAVVSQMADTIAVLRDGKVEESGPARRLIDAPQHPYTQRLLAASTHVPVRERGADGEVLLRVEEVRRDYPLGSGFSLGPKRVFRALDGVSLTIGRGESVGLVGESGSGKSTLARAILGLEPLDAGRVVFAGRDVERAGRAARLTLRDMQMVFQDPYGSFDPRHRVARLVAEPLHLLGRDAPRGRERAALVARVLESVGIEPKAADRYIHEFSGGQRQRIAIARALVIEPALIVLDEAVSALDVSIRAQVLDLLAEISQRAGIAYLFIAHDLQVVRAITDRVLVMEGGRIVEEGATERVLNDPRHAYTRTLVAAAPKLIA